MKNKYRIIFVLFFVVLFHNGWAVIIADNFNDNILDRTLWKPFYNHLGGQLQEADQKLEFTSTGGGSASIESNWGIDLTAPFKMKVDYDTTNASEESGVFIGMFELSFTHYKFSMRYPPAQQGFWVFRNHFFQPEEKSTGSLYLWLEDPYILKYGGYGFEGSVYGTTDFSEKGVTQACIRLGGACRGGTNSIFLDNFELLEGNVVFPQTVPEPMTMIMFALSFLGFAGIRRQGLRFI